MNKELEDFKRIFDYLLEADKNIWRVVVDIKDNDIQQLEKFVQPLMKMRGDIHVELMRPIYKKYPEIAEMAGFDTEDED